MNTTHEQNAFTIADRYLADVNLPTHSELLQAAQRAFRLIDDYSHTLAKAGANVDSVMAELLAAIRVM